MPNFIRQGELITVTVRHRSFTELARPDCGYMFDVDEKGTPLPKPWMEDPAKHVQYCIDLIAALERDPKFRDDGIEQYEQSYWQCVIIECDHCSKPVELHNPLTNECECGALYNGGGQLLAPRSQWEEEDLGPQDTWDVPDYEDRYYVDD